MFEDAEAIDAKEQDYDSKKGFMKLISFLFYYSKLLAGVVLGVHPTANPLNIKWRWSFWRRNYEKRSRR